jgi:hypothetical protein
MVVPFSGRASQTTVWRKIDGCNLESKQMAALISRLPKGALKPKGRDC